MSETPINVIENSQKQILASSSNNFQIELILDIGSEDFPYLIEISKYLAKQFPLIDLETQLAKKWQTLSPSDFGFHNALRKIDGSLVWLDFLIIHYILFKRNLLFYEQFV
mgnify:CR=1 FL=1